MKKRLYKIEKGKQLCGVCGGLAEYLDLDPTLVRILWVIITCFSAGCALAAYIVAAIIMPNKSDVEREMQEESKRANENANNNENK